MNKSKLDGCKVPVFSWCGALEDGAMEQIYNAARLPFAFDHVAIMPDGHQGYGAPIGGVFASEGVIIPNFVGVDIGCGMHAVRLSIKELERDKLKQLMGDMRKLIPVGFNHRAPVDPALMPKMPAYIKLEICAKQFDKARTQLGTLGGGNHFLEVQKDEEGYLWFMIHSGSRNIGLQVARHYNEVAKGLNAMWHTAVPAEFDLAFLPLGSSQAQAYLNEMDFCLNFARANRQMMADIIKELFAAHGATVLEEHDVHHNYAALEHHGTHNVWVHRKGATSARAGETGIIPGSQGTTSYIVEGLGNPLSFTSCSHGAGRAMSRSAATKNLVLSDEIKRLDDQGIIHGIRNQKDLDEAAGSYKDIVVVMEEQADLVKIIHTLHPLAVVKG